MPVELAYVADTVCVPTASELITSLARPVASRVSGPPVAVPSMLNVTDPAAAAGMTLAVNVTLWPDTDGLRLLVTTVVVAALFTVCVSAALVLPLNTVDAL